MLATALATGCGREAADTEGARNTADAVTSADGVRIAYEAYGEGTTALVFVHGWSCDRSYWEGQLEPFSRRFQVVAVDLAGHGESGLGRGTQTMGAFGGDVAAVVEKLGGGPRRGPGLGRPLQTTRDIPYSGTDSGNGRTVSRQLCRNDPRLRSGHVPTRC